MIYQCPVCRHPLTISADVAYCSLRHTFDRAKEGYFNLMPVQHKNSKLPGDSQLMMQARRAFLQAGHYQPLSEAVGQMVDQFLPTDATTLLDMGCGEGYYTGQLAKQCLQQKRTLTIFGIDIAKNAIKLAAKSYPEVHFSVASSYRLPFCDQSIGGLLRIYAPSDEEEMERVLNNKGIVITVTPAPNHLRELKALIYPTLRLHQARLENITNFSLIEQQRLTYRLNLAPQQRLNLLQMTPFYWKSTESMQRQLVELVDFSCEADFFITVYQKRC